MIPKTDSLVKDKEIAPYSTITGGYIDQNGVIYNLGSDYPSFSLKSVKITKGNIYILHSDSFMLNAEFPSVGFSVNEPSVGVKVSVIKTSKREEERVHIVYQPKEDGYLCIAGVDKGEIRVYTSKTAIEQTNMGYDDELLSYAQPLRGKTLAVLGDSIMMLMRDSHVSNTVNFIGTNGKTYSADEVRTSPNKDAKIVAREDTSIYCEVANSNQDGLNNQAWAKLKDKLHLRELINLGLGGARWRVTTAETTTPYPDDNAGNSIGTTCIPNEVRWLKKLVAEGTKPTPDVVMFWCGTNDSSSTDESEIGNYDTVMGYTWEEVSGDNELGVSIRRTIVGGLRYSLESVYRAFKYATIIVVSPVQSRYNSTKDYDTGNLGNIVEIVKKMSDRYACIYINAYHDIGICDLFELRDGDPSTSATWLNDGVHLTEEGKVLYTNYISKRITTKYFSKR